MPLLLEYETKISFSRDKAQSTYYLKMYAHCAGKGLNYINISVPMIYAIRWSLLLEMLRILSRSLYPKIFVLFSFVRPFNTGFTVRHCMALFAISPSILNYVH